MFEQIRDMITQGVDLASMRLWAWARVEAGDHPGGHGGPPGET